MRLYIVYFIYVNCSLYMFRAVTLLLSAVVEQSNCSTTAEGNRDGLTSARCCNYSYMCSWWWVDLLPETCKANSLQKYNGLYIVASCWTIIDNVPQNRCDVCTSVHSVLSQKTAMVYTVTTLSTSNLAASKRDTPFGSAIKIRITVTDELFPCNGHRLVRKVQDICG